jgi:hypothetical protein
MVDMIKRTSKGDNNKEILRAIDELRQDVKKELKISLYLTTVIFIFSLSVALLGMSVSFLVAQKYYEFMIYLFTGFVIIDVGIFFFEFKYKKIK